MLCKSVTTQCADRALHALVAIGIRDILVAIATYWKTEESGVQFPTGKRDFSLLHNIPRGCAASPTSYPMGAGSNFSSGKAARP
jgi:hypothetical protein